MVSSRGFCLGDLPDGVGMDKGTHCAEIEKVGNEKTHVSKN